LEKHFPAVINTRVVVVGGVFLALNLKSFEDGGKLNFIKKNC
jgi:hypothetical protein